MDRLRRILGLLAVVRFLIGLHRKVKGSTCIGGGRLREVVAHPDVARDELDEWLLVHAFEDLFGILFATESSVGCVAKDDGEIVEALPREVLARELVDPACSER